MVVRSQRGKGRSADERKTFDELVDELARSKIASADAYLYARSGPSPNGKTPPTADDARMGARVRLRETGVRDPEVVRWLLAAAIIELGGEPVSAEE